MILHIYAGNLYGGIETHLKTLIEADSFRGESGCRHQVALCFDGRLAEELNAIGRPAWMLGPVRLRYPWTTWRARAALKSYLKRNPISHIVAHTAWPYKLAWPVARACGVPIAFYNHDLLSGQSLLEKYAAAHPPACLISNSRFSVPGVEQLFGRNVNAVIHPVTKFNAIENPLNVRHIIRHELQTHEDAVVITQFSRFERWKGQLQLVNALGRLRQVPAWVAWLVGGVQKPDEIAFLDELKLRASELGIADRLRFTGQRADIPRILAASDIHCQPNTAPEPFGLAYVEALAAGLPSIGTDFGGAAEIITPGCGRLVPPHDEAALAHILTELITNPLLRQALGEHGPRRAAMLCDPQKALVQLEQMLAAAHNTMP